MVIIDIGTSLKYLCFTKHFRPVCNADYRNVFGFSIIFASS